MAGNDKLKMKNLVEQYYQGNFQIVIDHLKDNVKWTSHKMANVQLESKQEVVDFLNSVPVGRFTFKHTKYIIDDDNVVIEGVCSYTGKDGSPVKNFYCDIFTFHNNEIEKVSAYFV